MIYIDADERLTTWRLIAEAGNWELYRGQAQRGDVVVRWGANHGRYQNHYPEGVRVLNPRLLLSKIQQNAKFEQHDVPIPRIFRSRTEWNSAGNPTLITKPDIGQMGTGVVVVRRDPAFRSTQLYQLYIDKEREFRAMMVKDLLAFFMEKHRPANGDHRWNEHRGSEWSSVPEDTLLRRMVKEIGKRALDAIEYDFGAIDIISKNNNLYVLEVNSRPEFGQSNALRFARAVETYVEREAEPELCPHCGQAMPRR